MRLLFVSEGVHSHGPLQERLVAEARRRPGMTAASASVRHPGRLGFQLVRPIGFLGGLDLQPLRWRLRWSLAARRIVRGATPAPDAVFINTQACALALRGEMRARPVVLSVDATGRQFSQLAYWRPRDRFEGIADRALAALERRAYRDAAAVLAWTDWVAESLRSDYGVPSERIVTLNPGVEVQRFGRAAAERSEAGPLRVLFVGNGVERKGLSDLIDAVRGMDGAATLDAVTGDAVEEAPPVRVHRGLTPGSRRLVDMFDSADVFALPTRADAAPWALLEAMAAGLPVVSSPVGAIPELVGEAGILVPPRDVAALVEALRRLSGDPDLRRSLGRRGRERALEHYDASRQLPQLLDLLTSVAESSTR